MASACNNDCADRHLHRPTTESSHAHVTAGSLQPTSRIPYNSSNRGVGDEDIDSQATEPADHSTHQDSSSSDEDDHKLHFLLFGETGIGKSTLVNSLRDQEELEQSGNIAMTKDMVSASGDGTTELISEYAMRRIPGIDAEVVLWDTPGISSNDKTSIAEVTTLLKQEFGPDAKKLTGILVVQPSVQSNSANLGVSFLQQITAKGFVGESNRNNVILVGTKADQCTRPERDFGNFKNVIAADFFRAIFGDEFVPRRETHFAHTSFQKVLNIHGKEVDIVDTSELEMALRKCVDRGSKGHFNVDAGDLVEIAQNCLRLTEDQVREFVRRIECFEKEIEEHKKRCTELTQTVQHVEQDQVEVQKAYQYQAQLMTMTKHEVERRGKEWKMSLPHPRNKLGMALLCTGNSKKPPKKFEIVDALVRHRFPNFKSIVNHASDQELPPGWTAEPHYKENPDGTQRKAYTYFWDAHKVAHTESILQAWKTYEEQLGKEPVPVRQKQRAIKSRGWKRKSTSLEAPTYVKCRRSPHCDKDNGHRGRCLGPLIRREVAPQRGSYDPHSATQFCQKLGIM